MNHMGEKIMKIKKHIKIQVVIGLLYLSAAAVSSAAVLVQCPNDEADNDAVPDVATPNIKCAHMIAGDGFATMADGEPTYFFGYADVTGEPTKTQSQKDAVVNNGILSNQWPAPTIVLDEGDQFYLNLTNVGMMIRPDLFDTHTVHFHGYPESSTVFDGVPDSSISIIMGSTLTYYYKINDPGTYMWHCHVEATEHMQMGMLGNLYVRPAQNNNPPAGSPFVQFAYNDGDGSTGYDVEYPIQLGSFDFAFHKASETVQPLPFALMRDDYPMINGRGYPDTANPAEQTFPATPGSNANPLNPVPTLQTSQPVTSLITATSGQTILLRLSNLAITRYYTLQSPSIKMLVIGRDAKLLRAPNGDDLYYLTNSVTLAGGESVEVLLDTTGVAPGTYVLHTSNLNYLSNGDEPFGGMMTEILIN